MKVRAPVPAGVADGSLHSHEVDHFESEIGFMKIEETSPSLIKEAAASGNLEQLAFYLGAKQSKKVLIEALCYAAGAGKISSIKLLLDYVDVNSKNKTGRTALQWSARNGHLQSCKFLISKGADKFYITKDGISTLAWAISSKDIETVKYFIEEGLDVNLINRWGCSLIHWAAAGGSLSLCQYLKEVIGLDFEHQNNQGHNGLMKAAWNGHLAVCNYLLFGKIDSEYQNTLYQAIIRNRAPENNSSELYKAYLSAINLLLVTDRANLDVTEIAKINNKHHVAEYLEPLCCTVRENLRGLFPARPSGENSNKVPKQFDIFYRTQRIVSPSKYEELYKSLNTEQQVSIYVLMSDIFCESFRELVFNQLTNFDVHTFACAKDFKLIIKKQDWISNPKFRSYCNLVNAAGVILISFHGDTEHNILLTAMDFDKSFSQTVLCLNLERIPLMRLILSHLDKSSCLVINSYNQKELKMRTSVMRKRGSKKMLMLTVANSTKFPASRRGGFFNKVIVAPMNNEDGDCRLRPELLKNWDISTVLSNHAYNLKLLCQGLKCLRKSKNSLLVYTTRSLNPIDNEAVVLAALQRYKGQFTIEDVKNTKGSKGLVDWVVPDATVLKGYSLFRYTNDFNAVPEFDRFPNGPIRSTMFPNAGAKEENEHLKSCKRITPLDYDDCSCLFVAIFRPIQLEGDGSTQTLVTFDTNEEEIIQDVSHFYGLENTENMIVTPTQNIHLLSTLCSKLQENFASNHRIRVIHAGLSLFERTNQFQKELSNRWRMTQQGSYTLSKIKRQVTVNWFATCDPKLSLLLSSRELSLDTKAQEFFHGALSPGGFLLKLVDTSNIEVFYLSCILTANKILCFVDSPSAQLLQTILDVEKYPKLP